MSSFPSNEFIDPFLRRKILLKALMSHGLRHNVIWFAKNNFFLSFEINGGSYSLSQNTTRKIGH